MIYNSIKIIKNEDIGIMFFTKTEKMNAVDVDMCAEIVYSLENIASDNNIRVLIISGKGRSFCAGGDLTSSIYDKMDPKQLDEIIMMFGKVSITIREMPKPVIAMVNGVAVGAGLSFALACDIRIASERARFGHVYMNLGVQSDAGGLFFLPQIVGIGKACELVFTGKIIDAYEAEQIGLVNKVVPDEKLEEETMHLAREIAEKPAFAMGFAKQSLYRSATMDLLSAIEYEARAHTLTMLSRDMREGLAAFHDKRRPKYE